MRHSFLTGMCQLSVIFGLLLPLTVLAQTTTRVSIDSAGMEADNSSFLASVSADGRFVAFQSHATNLVVGDTNIAQDIFVHDRQSGETTRVSVDSAGLQATGGDSFSVSATSISADGRFVVFESEASNLIAVDTNGTWDIFVHDRQSGETTRVNVDSAGLQATGGRSGNSSISADGHFVVFESEASNLVAGDTNNKTDVFVHDRQSGQTTRVSVDSAGTEANGHSLFPTISADGRFLVFESVASNLIAVDTNGVYDIFVHDRQSEQTTRVSVDSAGVESEKHSFLATISADGRFVAFESDASNLVAVDTNGAWDIFVHDSQSSVTTRVNIDSAGMQATGGNSYSSSMSADGRFVVFESEASNLVAGDINGDFDVFVHDRQIGETRRVSVTNAGAQTTNGNSIEPSISADGRFVAFDGPATDLVANDTNGQRDIFVRGPLYESMTDLTIDFGGIGLWARLNDASWLKLHNNSPAQVVTADMDGNAQNDVVAVFGSGIFVKRNLGGWAKLHNFIPDAMVVGDLDNNGRDDVVIDFGGIGLWARMNDSSWLKLHNSSPIKIVVGDIDGNGEDDVIADYSSSFGGIFVKRNLGAWTKLHNSVPDALTVGDLDNNGKDDIVIDFGNIGLWARMNDSSWLKLHNTSPDLITIGDTDGNGAADVIATFGSSFGGLWQKQNLGGWSNLSANAPDEILTSDIDGSGEDDVIGNFGSTIGGIYVKRNQGAWSKLHNSTPDSMTVGNLNFD